MRSFILHVLLLISSVAVAQQPTFNASSSGICAPVAVEFTDVSELPGTIVKRVWDFGDGNSGIFVAGEKIASHNYTNGGAFSVTLTLIMKDGSQFISASQTVIVRPTPIAAFTASSLAGCPPLNVQFTDNSTSSTGAITKWQWDFGDGNSTTQNPDHLFTSKKGTPVSLIVYNEYNCKSETAAKNTIQLHEPPAASFTTNSKGSCSVPVEITLTNTSQETDVISYLWDFGDGATSTEKNPKHVYTIAGAYNIQLTLNNGTTCATQTASSLVYAGTPQISATSAPPVICTKKETNFQASVLPSSLAQNISWYFPDTKTTVSGASVNHTFNEQGSYSIQVKASSAIGCTSPEITLASVVQISPVASFSALPDNICEQPFKVSFSNTSASKGSNYEYNWNFGDGETSTVEDPVHSYTSASPKPVSFLIRDKTTGCESPLINQNIAINPPTVSLSVNSNGGCKPLVIQAKATIASSDPITSYQWNWGDNSNTTTSSNTATHFYVDKGLYTITVVATTINGCSVTSNASTIDVSDNCKDDGSGPADAPGGFTFVNTCGKKSALTFTDNFSKLPGNNYKVVSWDFGDGSGAGAQNPASHTYAGTGTRDYIVTVTRKDALTGSISTSSKTMVIIDEQAAFSVNKTATCTQVSISFNTSGIHPEYIKQYKWDFGDGSFKTINNTAYDPREDGSTTHTFSADNQYYVTLTITDKLGCTSSFKYPTAISISGPKADYEAPTITSCKESTFTRLFIDKSAGNKSVPIEKWDWYVWRTGDAQPSTPTLSYNKDNIPQNIELPFKNTSEIFSEYSVKLIVTDADKCKSGPKTISRYIKSYWPKADFNTDRDSLCGNRNINFFNASATATANPKCSWDFGDGNSSTLANPLHLYESDGKYTIKLTVVEQNLPTCTDAIEKKDFIKIVKPIADFLVGDVSECPPVAVGFTNKSVNAGKYTWTFDEGGVLEQQDVSGHIYEMGGDYKVKLHVEGIDGCMDDVVKYIHIKGPSGKLNYEHAVGCAPFNFEMQVTESKNISSYRWDFGDGTAPAQPSEASQQHTYVVARKYLPNVIISGYDGCSISLVKGDSVVVDKASASFQLDDLRFCGNGVAGLKELSTIAEFSEITSYKWTINGELVSEERQPAPFNCNAPGEYEVALTIKSEHGCEALASEKVNVYPKPVVNINGKEIICLVKDAINFNYSSVILSPDAIQSYSWLIGDALISTNENPDVDYRKPGTHDLKLVATTINGCMDSSTKKIIIDSVRAGLTASSDAVCGENRNILFTNTSTLAGKVADVTWDFGDGNTTSASNIISHNYNMYGDVKAIVSVTSENGCIDKSDPVAIHFYQSPNVNIPGNDVVCLSPGLPSLKDSPDVLSADAVKSYKWLINDSIITEEKELSFDYRRSGTHDLKLIATTINGCIDSSTKKIIIDSVRAGFTTSSDAICGENRNILFTNTSTLAGKIADVTWDFGDGNTSSANNKVSHNYNMYGDVKTVISVTTENGCLDRSDPVTIHLYQSPNVKIQGSDVVCLSPGLPSLEYSSDILSADVVKSYTWTIDDASISETERLNVDYRQAGKHILKLTATTDMGCMDAAAMAITIDSVRADFVVLDSVRCGAGDARLMNKSTSAFPVSGFEWHVDKLISSGQSELLHSFSKKGTYPASLTVTTENGCSASIIKAGAVVIYENPEVQLFVEKESCLNKPVGFTATTSCADKITDYRWLLNETPIEGETNSASKIFANAGDYVVHYNAISEHGCLATSSLPLVIHPLPLLAMTRDTAVCKGAGITLQAVGAETCLWSAFAGDSITNDMQSLFVKPLISTMYHLTASNNYGCSITDSVYVKVDNPVDLTLCNAQTICEGAKAQLWAGGNTSKFQWDNSSTLNNSAIASPVASPVASTIYRVTGISENACASEERSVKVEVVKNPVVSLGPDIIVEQGSPLILHASVSGNIQSYLWTLQQAFKSASYNDLSFIADKDVYVVLQVATQEGCKGSDSIAIHVLNRNPSIYIPTAFSPNGDGVNDIFYVRGNGIKKIKSFKIFDRWGKLVFHNENCIPNEKKAGWDGQVNGSVISQTSTFVYIVDAVCQDGKDIQLKGTVVLIR